MANLSQGLCARSPQKLLTRAADEPTINSPPSNTPINSAEWMFRSSMNSARVSVQGLRDGLTGAGGFGTAGFGMADSGFIAVDGFAGEVAAGFWIDSPAETRGGGGIGPSTGFFSTNSAAMTSPISIVGDGGFLASGLGAGVENGERSTEVAGCWAGPISLCRRRSIMADRSPATVVFRVPAVWKRLSWRVIAVRSANSRAAGPWSSRPHHSQRSRERRVARSHHAHGSTAASLVMSGWSDIWRKNHASATQIPWPTNVTISSTMNKNTST